MSKELFNEISELRTEQINEFTKDIDIIPTISILELINNEDAKIAEAVHKELPYIEKAVNQITANFKRGGRLIYVGAGTSGRLGILDASECPPTFGTDPEMIQGIIAGGRDAVFLSQEGAEDSIENGEDEIRNIKITENDTVCGIAASGRTPFVRGALEEASRKRAYTILLSTSSREHIKTLNIPADIIISPNVGPEAIAGSTRMKSGTAQKMVLNMLTTASMIKLGKTFGNVMVDLQLTNAKLNERAKKVIMEVTGADYNLASRFLKSSGGKVKTAIVMLLGDLTLAQAEQRLKEADGFVKKCF